MIAWYTRETTNSRFATAIDQLSHVYVYDIQNDTVTRLPTQEGQSEELPFVSDQKILYDVRPSDQIPFPRGELHVWSRHDGKERPLPIAIPGLKAAQAFNGKWALFSNEDMHNPDHDGLYAFNLETLETKLVFKKIPGPPCCILEGVAESARATKIDGDLAYYMVYLTDYATSNQSYQYYMTNLTTGERKNLFEISGPNPINVYSIKNPSDGWRVFSRGLQAMAINLTDGREIPLSPADASSSGGMAEAHGVAAFTWSNRTDSPLVAYNLTTGLMKRWPALPNQDIGFRVASMDDKRIVATCNLGKNYMRPGEHICWLDLAGGWFPAPKYSV